MAPVGAVRHGQLAAQDFFAYQADGGTPPVNGGVRLRVGLWSGVRSGGLSEGGDWVGGSGPVQGGLCWESVHGGFGTVSGLCSLCWEAEESRGVVCVDCCCGDWLSVCPVSCVSSVSVANCVCVL